MRYAVLCLALAATACDSCQGKTRSSPPDAAKADASLPPKPMPAGWLKGQLHAHTSASGDSKTSPADVHRWYEEHGYDFVVFTDHNAIVDTYDSTRTLTMPGVELTWNHTGAFHMNALFVDAADAGAGPIAFGYVASGARSEVYLHELKRAQALGGIAMLNHPNMRWGASGEALILDLARQGLTLMEVKNESWDSDNAGDATHPSTEALWDAVLAQRLPVFATATDDAHHYYDAPQMTRDGEHPFSGDIGFVVVRAAKDAASIRAAITKGDFYASNGVAFTSYDARPGSISLATEGEAVFEIIGKGGKVLRYQRGTRAEAKLGPGDGPYLRVRVTREDGKKAWTQAVFAIE